jgi:hypothetical protein
MTERPAWWDSPAIAALAILLATMPLLYPPIPPLVDLLGHMGRFRVELDGGHSPWLQQYYSYRWAPIGNLGVDILVRPLAPVLGLELAVKLIVVAIPALTAAGLLWVAREVHGRIPPTAYFAIPFVYGHPFLYGFVNFALAMGLALLGLGLWLRLGRLGRTKLRAALFVPISLIVFFAHAFGWGVLGLMCFVAEAVRRNERGATWTRALFEAALAASVMALPLIVMLAWRSGTQGGGTGYWFDFQAKLVWIETALRDRWRWLDVVSVFAAILVLAQALRSPRLTLSRELAYPGLVLLGIFFLLPDLIFESAYADMRLVPYIFAIFLIAVRVEPGAPRSYATTLAVLAAAFVAVRLTANTISFAVAADDQQAKSAAVAHIPEGARVATFLRLPCGGPWELQRNSHLGSLAIIRRQGFSNDQWLTKALNIMDIKYRNPGYYAADPSQFVLPNGCSDGLHRTIDVTLASFPRSDFDYVWLVDAPAFDPRLVKGLDPIWQGAGTVLYRIRS